MKIEQLIEQDTGILVPLYRGVRTGTAKKGSIFTASVRQDRRPSDTDFFDSALFNYGIELMLGIAEIRKRAVFASTSLETASNYANMGMERDGKARANGVVQLILEPSTSIVYHPEVRDSMDLFEQGAVDVEHPLVELMECLKEFVNVSSNAFWTVSREAIAGAGYVENNALQFFQNVFGAMGIERLVPADKLAEIEAQFFFFLS